MINGIHHMAVSTGDLDRLSAFYCDGFGFVEADRYGWSRGNPAIDKVVGLKDSAARAIFLRAGNCYLELFEYSSPTPRPADPDRPACDHGYTHFCVDVTDINAVCERLRGLGATFNTDPIFHMEMGLAATYGRDPDGNIFELQEILKDDHAFHLKRSGTADTQRD